MPPISKELHLILIVIAGLSTLVFTIVLIPLSPSIAYFFEKNAKNQPIHKKPAGKPAILWVILIFAGLGMTVGGIVNGIAPVIETTKMSGDFRIAIASFQEIGDLPSDDLGTQLAQSVKIRIENNIAEINPEPTLGIWGPTELAANGEDTISGSSADERANAAEKLADQIGANLIVYGSLENIDGRLIYKPEFFVRDENFYEAQEIIGSHEFGEAITLKTSETGGRIQIGSAMFVRCKALTNIAIGLLHYFDQDYALAIDAYKLAADTNGWTDPQGKEIVFLLIGNSYARLYAQEANDEKSMDEDHLKNAKAYYEKAVNIDPQYSRAYIGLGSTYYNLSLLPYNLSRKPSDIDADLLLHSKMYFENALAAGNQPPLADIPVKAHFGFGEDYLMQAFSGQIDSLDPAISEFNFVISAYGNGNNQRIAELAAEAHARLGLAYFLSNHLKEASLEYHTAADLYPAGSERRKLYQSRAAALQSQNPTPDLLLK